MSAGVVGIAERATASASASDNQPVLVSAASWAFLELVALIQEFVYERVPSALGHDVLPWWWPLPVLAVGGAITAFAVVRLPVPEAKVGPAVDRLVGTI